MYADAAFLDEPAWSRQPARRLAASLLPATLIVVCVLALLRLPVVEQQAQPAEVFVRILEPERPVEVPDRPAPVTDVPAATTAIAAQPEPQQSIVSNPVSRDWYAMIPEAAEAAVDEESRTWSVNPRFEERRRYAAEKFRPSRAPVDRPVWENVERDTLGRSILVSGNCMRVLDDPNVGSRDAFLTFGQYIVHCRRESDKPRPLPWVKEIQSRREALARSARRVAE